MAKSRIFYIFTLRGKKEKERFAEISGNPMASCSTKGIRVLGG